MRKIKIAFSEIEISDIAYGVANFGTEVTGSKADELTSEYISSGGNTLDTAHCYAFWEKGGLGVSEKELGAAIRRLGCRESVVIVSKGGHTDGGSDYPRPADFLSEKIIQSDLNESIDRLGYDIIDIYFLHRDDGITPVSEIIEMMNIHLRTGAIRVLGASNWSVERIESANSYAREKSLQGFSISQIAGSLAVPDWEVTTDPTMRYISTDEISYHTKSRMPVMAYSSTACGYFAGKGHDKGNYASKENEIRYRRSKELSVELECTPTQIAISWLLHQPFPVVPLFSTGKIEHMQEVMSSVKVTLSHEQVKWLNGSE